MILEARWFCRELFSNACHWSDRLQPVGGYIISTLLEITMEMAKKTAQDDASEKKKKRRKWKKKGRKEGATPRIRSCGAISRFRRPCGELSTCLRKNEITYAVIRS